MSSSCGHCSLSSPVVCTPAPGLFICFALHIVCSSKESKQCLLKQIHFVSRFYLDQVLHKNRIQSHFRCHVTLLFPPLIIAFLFLLSMQFSFFRSIVLNYIEFRYGFFYSRICSGTLSQLDLCLTSGFAWADRCILGAVNIANQGYRNLLAP